MIHCPSFAPLVTPMPRTLRNLPTRAPRWLYAQTRYLNNKPGATTFNLHLPGGAPAEAAGPRPLAPSLY